MFLKLLTITAFSLLLIGLLAANEPTEKPITPESVKISQDDSLNFSDEGLEMVVMADGTKMIDLQGRFEMTSVIKPKPDGSVAHYCTGHPDTLSATEHKALHTPNQVK